MWVSASTARFSPSRSSRRRGSPASYARCAPLDVTRAAEAAASRIERALADGSAEADAETTADGVRVLLMALEDLAEGPEPAGPLQALKDALAAEARAAGRLTIPWRAAPP